LLNKIYTKQCYCKVCEGIVSWSKGNLLSRLVIIQRVWIKNSRTWKMALYLQFTVSLTYSKLWQCHIMLFCGPNYNTAIKCSAFGLEKQLFISDTLVVDFEIMNHFSASYYYTCIYILRHHYFRTMYISNETVGTWTCPLTFRHC
jgi:hypothetical protein